MRYWCGVRKYIITSIGSGVKRNACVGLAADERAQQPSRAHRKYETNH